MNRVTRVVRGILTSTYDNSWYAVFAWLVFFVVGAMLKLAEPQSWGLPLFGAAVAGISTGLIVRRLEFPQDRSR